MPNNCESQQEGKVGHVTYFVAFSNTYIAEIELISFNLKVDFCVSTMWLNATLHMPNNQLC
jgi:hypothetical protein